MGRNQLSPIAIDFGEHAVKVVQLERRGGDLSLRDVRSVELSAGTDDTSRHDQLVRVLRSVLNHGSFRGREALTSLRLRDVTTRHIRVPAERFADYGRFLVEEIREQAAAAADSKPGDELSFCALPVAELLDQGQQRREYLCCIANAAAVRDQIDVLREVRLTPVAIDLETCAQVRPFATDPLRSSFLSVDFGHHSSRITIVRDGAPVLMRAVNVGGSEMAHTLRQKLDLDVDAILDLAAEEGESEALMLPVTRALAEQLDIVLTRIADCVRYCASLFQGRAVSLLRVMGGVSSLPGVVPYIGRRIGIKAIAGDPFEALALPYPECRTRANRCDYSTAIGLAMRGLTR